MAGSCDRTLAQTVNEHCDARAHPRRAHLEIERSHETSHDELGAPRAHGPSPQGGRLPSPTGLEAAHAHARGPAPVVV